MQKWGTDIPDIIKKAMISLHGWLKQSAWPARLLLQVHDELVFEVRENRVREYVSHIRSAMEGVATLKVPIGVDMKVGHNWNEMEQCKP